MVHSAEPPLLYQLSLHQVDESLICRESLESCSSNMIAVSSAFAINGFVQPLPDSGGLIPDAFSCAVFICGDLVSISSALPVSHLRVPTAVGCILRMYRFFRIH